MMQRRQWFARRSANFDDYYDSPMVQMRRAFDDGRGIIYLEQM